MPDSTTVPDHIKAWDDAVDAYFAANSTKAFMDDLARYSDAHDDYAPCCDQMELEERTGYPVDRSGRCEVYLVCVSCEHEHGIVGSDGVL